VDTLTPSPGHRRRIVAKVVVLGAVTAIAIVVLLPQYADYAPREAVRQVMTAAYPVRQQLAEDCGPASARITQATAERAMSQLAPSKHVSARKLSMAPDGSVIVELTLNEVRWRFGSTAIPAGSTLVWNGRCAGEGTFEWLLSKTSTVPAIFLPRQSVNPATP